MGKELSIPLLMPHHFKVFDNRAYRARKYGYTFEEMANKHADELLTERSGDYLFLIDPVAREKFVKASVYVMRQVEGKTILLTPEYYTDNDGKEHKRVDWFCENGCGNFYIDTDGIAKCKAEEKRKSLILELGLEEEVDKVT